MKVVYVKPVLEMIRDARDEAERRGKKIEYIELTEPEWKEIAGCFPTPPINGYFAPFFKNYVLGVEVRKAP